MFEARLTQGSLLKKLVDAVKELVTDVNFDVSPGGLQCQVKTAVWAVRTRQEWSGS
jgi:hypothetical protein